VIGAFGMGGTSGSSASAERGTDELSVMIGLAEMV
jgi:hypothetical protein